MCHLELLYCVVDVVAHMHYGNAAFACTVLTYRNVIIKSTNR
jgi:hypothetical protein